MFPTFETWATTLILLTYIVLKLQEVSHFCGYLCFTSDCKNGKCLNLRGCDQRGKIISSYSSNGFSGNLTNQIHSFKDI